MTRTFDAAAAAQLRRTYQTETVVEQRRRTRERFAASPGEHLVDLGCGPGLLAVELAASVGPDGLVTAIDPSAPMRGVATEEAATRHLSDRVHVVDGDAANIPVATGEVDGVAVVQVLEHVEDVPAALTEVHRVLRPGGRVLIIDTDWRSCVWHSADPERTERVIAAWRTRFHHPQLPVELEGHLLEAGFRDIEVEPLPLLERATGGDAYHLGMVGTIAAHVATQPTVGPTDAAAWREDVQSVARDGHAFFGLTRYLFTASR
jgi:arsenite methyltransferase